MVSSQELHAKVSGIMEELGAIQSEFAPGIVSEAQSAMAAKASNNHINGGNNYVRRSE